MQDRVGNKVPSEQEIEKLVRDVNAVAAKVEAHTVALTTEQRAATTKMRTGGESVVATIGHMATEHGVALPGISVEAMNADFQLAQRLEPLAAAVGGLASRLDDTVLEAQSEGWWAATAFYTSLARLGHRARAAIGAQAGGRVLRRGPAQGEGGGERDGADGLNRSAARPTCRPAAGADSLRAG